jgi:sarcosine oxidase subunit gamma
MWNEKASDVAMLDDHVRLESPLVGARALLESGDLQGSLAFRMRERALLDVVNIRGDVRDAAFIDAVQSVLGTSVPVTPNTVARANEYDVLWLGPDEWLVRSNEARVATLEAKFKRAFAGVFATAVDVGSGYTVLEVSGMRVRDVLSRGCPLDLHPRVLAPGRCAQSHYFKASIVLVPTADDAFEVLVRRSFADYCCRIMLDAAAPLLS